MVDYYNKWYRIIVRVLLRVLGLVLSMIVFGIGFRLWSNDLSFVRFAVSIPLVTISSGFFIYNLRELVSMVVGRVGDIPTRFKDKGAK